MENKIRRNNDPHIGIAVLGFKYQGPTTEKLIVNGFE